VSRGIRPRWPIGFRRNYHLLSYFLPGLFTSLSLFLSPLLLFPSCRKNLSSFFPQGDITRTCLLVSALVCPESSTPPWRPDFSVLRSFLPFPVLSLSLSHFLSRSFIFWTLILFHLLFSHIVLLFFLFVFLVRNSSIMSPLHHLPFLISFLFFSLRRARKNLTTFILQPLMPQVKV